MNILNLLFSLTGLCLIACGCATLIYKYKVINFLKRKHPEVYSSIGLTEKFNDQQIQVEDSFYEFISSNKYLRLNDMDLNKFSARYKFLGRLTIGLFLSLLIIGFMGGRLQQ